MAIRIRGQRKLATPPGQNTRPTTAKVRAAIFNIWQRTVSGSRFLDLCSGSGAIGAEALLRGARYVVGIEKDPQACKLIQQNWQPIAQANQQFQVIRGDVLKVLPGLAPQQFDHIYFDPPYDSQLYEPVLHMLTGLGLLAPSGELAFECRTHQLPDVGNISISRKKVYGSTTLVLMSELSPPPESWH